MGGVPSSDSGKSSGSSLSRSVKSGIVWSTLTFGLTKGATFLSLLVLARILSPSEFGVVAGVSVVLSFVELTADVGMKANVIYEQSGEYAGERLDNAFTLTLLVTTLLTVVAVLLAPLLASFFHASNHTGLFQLAGLDILVTGLGSIQDGLVLRDMRFRARIVTEVLGAVVRAGLGVGLALAGFGAASMVWGFIAGSAVTTASLWIVTGYVPRLRLRAAIVKSMIGYGAGASMLSVITQITGQVDVLAIGRVLGQRALGLYALALRLPSLLLENIAYQVSLVAFPALARKRVTDESGVGATTNRLVLYQSLYALPLGAGMAVLAQPIVVTLFSSKWIDAAGVFAAVSVMSAIHASTFALGDAFKALGRQRVMVALNLIELPILVGAIIVVAPAGITAVAWARCAVIGLWVVLMTVSAARVLHVPARHTMRSMWPGTAGAIGVAAGAGAVRLWSGLPDLAQVLVGGVAGAVGGIIALAVLAPSVFRELTAGLRRSRAGALRGASSSP